MTVPGLFKKWLRPLAYDANVWRKCSGSMTSYFPKTRCSHVGIMSHLGLCHSNISNDSPFSIQDFCWSAMYSRWKKSLFRNGTPQNLCGSLVYRCIVQRGTIEKNAWKNEVVFCFMTCHFSRCLPASSQYQWTQSNIWTIGFQYSLRFSGKKHLDKGRVSLVCALHSPNFQQTIVAKCPNYWETSCPNIW